jgi:hypothetical protein
VTGVQPPSTSANDAEVIPPTSTFSPLILSEGNSKEPSLAEAGTILATAEAATDLNAEAWEVLAAEATGTLIDGSIAGVSRSSKSPESTVPKEN